MKKLLAITLVAALFFTACGNGTPSSTPVESTGETSTSSTSSDSGSTPNTATPAGDVVTLNVLCAYFPSDPNKEPPHQKIIDKIGYNLNMQMLPAERADEKLNLELASGANYDLLMLTPVQYRTLAGKNAFLELDDLLAEHGPNVMSSIKDHEWPSALVDGKTLGVPTFDAKYIGNGIAVNLDVLEAAGHTFSNTMSRDEFTQLLRDIKASNPDIIPFTGNGAWIDMIMSSFGITQHQYAVIDGQLDSRMDNENLKNYVEYMNMLYKEGLIDPEWPTNTGEVVNEKFSSGLAAMANMGWSNATTINEGVKKNTGSDVDYILPLQDEAGNAIKGVNIGVTGYRAIPKNAKQAEEVVRFWNAYSDPANFTEIFIGEEGVHHEIREVDGVKEYWPIFPEFTDWFNGHYFNQPVSSDVFTTLWLCRVRKSEEVYSAFERMNKLDEQYWVESALAYAPPMDAITKYGQPLEQMAMDNVVEFIAGSKDLSEWDAFVEKWHNEGGNEMTQEVEAYFAEQYK